MNIKTLFTLTILVCGTCFLSFRARTKQIDPMVLLEKAELQRIPWKSMSLDARIVNDNEDQSNHLYRVFYQNDKTLVAFLGPDTEKGNLLLMKGNDLWFYVNSTSRPTRITPIQRLSGSTSFGDLARLEWSEDYTIDKMIETNINVNGKTTKAYQFSLSAKSSGATYQTISLWIDQTNHRPIKSEVYLTSGKLYKTLIFSKYQTHAEKIVNTQITFQDHFNSNRMSILNFTNIKEDKELPNRYFVKTMLPEVSNELVQ